jgi:hypothetical protein
MDKSATLYIEHRTLQLPLYPPTEHQPMPLWPDTIKREFRECEYHPEDPRATAVSHKKRPDLAMNGQQQIGWRLGNCRTVLPCDHARCRRGRTVAGKCGRRSVVAVSARCRCAAIEDADRRWPLPPLTRDGALCRRLTAARTLPAACLVVDPVTCAGPALGEKMRADSLWVKHYFE